MSRISYNRKEKKRKDNLRAEREEEECANNQQNAHDAGFCCHHHAKKIKVKEENEREVKKRAKVDGPDYCIHCDTDPCVIAQIEARLCENDTIYYDEREYENSPVTYNSGRRKRAYQYAAFVLWEGINYRQPHFTWVKRGVRALFPPLDGKIMGYKNDRMWRRSQLSFPVLNI
jgi:hypothetical protein